MGFSSEAFQFGAFQQDPFGRKPVGDSYPTALAVLVRGSWLAVSGVVEGTALSAVRYLAGSRLDLRCRFSDPVRVRVQRRPAALWYDCFDDTGMEFGGLVKAPGGGDVRIVVEGEALGTAELVEV